jgi:repressor LexA
MTPERLRIVDAVRASIEQRGFSPSIREIAAAIGQKGPGGVHTAVQLMIRDGELIRLPGAIRNVGLPVPDLTAATTQALRAELARRENAHG